MASPAFNVVAILRKPAVAARTSLSRSTIDLLVRKGKFPAPVKLTEHAIGWRLADVDAWLESRATVVPEHGNSTGRSGDAVETKEG